VVKHAWKPRPSDIQSAESFQSSFASRRADTARLRRSKSPGVSSIRTPSQEHNSLKRCDDCEEFNSDMSFCNVCRLHFCPRCWDNQLSHRRKMTGPGGIPHERTRASVAEKVQRVLEPPLEESVRKKLYMDDEETAWFGMFRLTLTQDDASDALIR